MSRKNWDAVLAIQMPVASYIVEFEGACRILDFDTALSYQMRQRYLLQYQAGSRIRSYVSWRKLQRYETRFVSKFDACTLASPLELAYVSGLSKNSSCRVELLPNGADCEYYQVAAAPRQSNTLIFNGALSYDVNLEGIRFFLAGVYPLIQKAVPDVKLIITGSIDGVELSGLQVDSSVQFTGYVKDIRPLVASAFVCVVPILTGGGTRIKILEAMALGTPVVSTKKGAEGLAVVDQMHLSIAGDAAEMAARTIQLLQDPGLRECFAVNARSLVESHYDWASIGRSFVQLVEETTESQKRRAG